jgi:hypothetical protein
MITIFGDFRLFSAIFAYFRRFSPIFGKQLAFFSQTNFMAQFLLKEAKTKNAKNYFA